MGVKLFSEPKSYNGVKVTAFLIVLHSYDPNSVFTFPLAKLISKNMKIKQILFDMGGVVFLQDTEEAEYRFRALGLDTDKYMGQFGQKDFFMDVENGSISPKEFCRRLAQVLGRKEISFQEAQHCWLGFVKGVPKERLQWLSELREDYSLGLLSNTNPFIMDYTNSLRFSKEGKPISSYFDNMFLSYEMKVCKPDPEIFKEALRRSGYTADETLFVDDSIKNIKAAEACGIHGLHIPSNEDWYEPLMQKLKEIG